MHKNISILFVLLFLLLLFPFLTIVSNYITGHTAYVSLNEVINKNLFLSGDRITIDGTINGDVYAFAKTVVINGRVNGDIYASGGTVSIGGYVRDSVVIAAQNVSLSSSPSSSGGVVFAAKRLENVK